MPQATGGTVAEALGTSVSGSVVGQLGRREGDSAGGD